MNWISIKDTDGIKFVPYSDHAMNVNIFCCDHCASFLTPFLVSLLMKTPAPFFSGMLAAGWLPVNRAAMPASLWGHLVIGPFYQPLFQIWEKNKSKMSYSPPPTSCRGPEFEWSSSARQSIPQLQDQPVIFLWLLCSSLSLPLCIYRAKTVSIKLNQIQLWLFK